MLGLKPLVSVALELEPLIVVVFYPMNPFVVLEVADVVVLFHQRWLGALCFDNLFVRLELVDVALLFR
jgi:hypothetical protein